MAKSRRHAYARPKSMPNPLPSTGPLRTVGEIALLLALGSTWFFWGTSNGDFVGTEPLRAVVAKEMLERDEYLIPTVHHRTYLRKPPLYAWTTAALAGAVGRLDEQVARWPSAAMGVLYLLALYVGGRQLIGPQAGLPTAALGGANWLVVDYGGRAELDAGLLAMSTWSILASGVAWTGGRRGRTAWFAAAYVAATLGSLWKAPHVLWMLWLSQLGMVWWDRRQGVAAAWRKLLHPANVVGSIGSCAMLATYALLLSKAAGAGRVGRFAVGELFARLIPHSLSDVLGILFAIPELAVNALPAAALALLLLLPRRRDPSAVKSVAASPLQAGASWSERCRQAVFARLPGRVILLCDASAAARASIHAAHPAAIQVLLAWFVPNLIFLTIIPAKAPRYWFGVFGAIALLATLAWQYLASDGADERLCAIARRMIRTAAAIGAAAGLGLIAAGAVAATRGIHAGLTFTGAAVAAAFVCGVAIVLLGWQTWRLNDGAMLSRGPALVLLMLVAAKPVHALAIIPGRASLQSLRPAAQRIDAVVPPGRIVYVLSDRDDNDRSGELSDFGYYCTHSLRWPRRAGDIPDLWDGLDAWLLVRDEALARLMSQFGPRCRTIQNLSPMGKDVFVVHLGAASPRGVILQPVNAGR